MTLKAGDVFRSPWFAAAVTALAAFTGLWGSLYSGAIKSAFPFYWGPDWGRLVPSALLFWLLFFIATLAYWLRQVAIDRSRQRSEKRFADSANTLLEQSAKLEDIYRTLPPDAFLDLFNDSYAKCSKNVFDLLWGKEEDRTPDVIDAAIMKTLEAIGLLACHFDADEKPDQVRYAANIMSFKPIAECRNASDGIRFLDCGLEDLQGILKLEPQYSVVIQGKTASPDPELPILSLPVPLRDRTKQDKWRALPGAPLAFCQKDGCCYRDTATMSDWCRDNGDFHLSVRTELSDFFQGASPNIRSLVSIPIVSFGKPCVGVVNIHRNRTDILRREEARDSFYNMVAPFCSLLAQLFDMPKFSAPSARLPTLLPPNQQADDTNGAANATPPTSSGGT